MIGFIFEMFIGILIFFVMPLIIPHSYRGPQFGLGRIQGNLWTSAVKLVGVLFMVFAVFSTSYVQVGDGRVGHLFRVYGGGALTEGKIVAVKGENGPQGRVLRPGFYPELLINVLYTVDTNTKETEIPDGKLGVLVAKDGKPFRPGQAFADPFPANLGYNMLDAATFIENGGQRGPQLTVLTPGKYVLNHYLWHIEINDAKDLPTGFVGVVKSNVWADVDFGTLRASKPAKCDVIAAKDAGEGRIEAPLVPVGCVGVWQASLQPGKYYFNPDAFTLTEIDTRAQVWTYAGGYERCTITLKVDSKGEIEQDRKCVLVPFDPKTDADRAVFVKMEGWDVPLELRVVAQVSPSEASCVIAGVGSLKEVEDRVLTPSIRAIVRDVAGGTYDVEEAKLDEKNKPILDAEGKPIIIKVKRPTKVLDLINQRPLLEAEVERRIRPEGQKSCVSIREVRLGEPAIPPELLVAVRREQLATQLALAYIQEQAAQTKRIDSEKAKATADQQHTLVQAEIGVQTSQQRAVAARNEGQGERDKLILIAEGQKAQTEILGQDATVKLRQYELTVATVSTFFTQHPEVLTAALTNAQKFVPQVSVGSSSGLLDGLLANMFSGQTLAPASAPTGTQRGSAQR